jgi:nucleoside-diphosphate-sugar epimerase
MLSGQSILITGGLGYIGQVLTRQLLDKTSATITLVDSNVYNIRSTYEFDASSDRVTIIYKDALEYVLEDLKSEFSSVIVLHGLVGDPISNKYKEVARRFNEIEMKEFIDLVSARTKRIIFASTCSNYGITNTDLLANEESVLNPLSPYSKSKVAIEHHILNKFNTPKKRCNWTILRFATAFGPSPRMRFDLTLNEFTKDSYFGKEILVYDADSWRPYLHTEDISHAIRLVIEADLSLVSGEIFNVGDNSNNITKRGIIKLLMNVTPELKVKFEGAGRDPRDYRVDFGKINKTLKFEASRGIKDGILEIIKFIEENRQMTYETFSNLGNFTIQEKYLNES